MSQYKMVELGTLIKQAKTVRCGSNDYPVLSMTMHDGLVFQNDKFKKTIASKDRSDYKVVKRNQLVISFPIDEGVLAAQRIVDAGIVSPAYGIWDIDQGSILTEFLEYALRCDRALSYYKANLRGSTARRRNLPTPVLLAYTVPLPDVSEQKFILNVIRKSRQIINNRSKELQKLDELVKARFVELFGDLKTNPKSWKVVPFSEFAEIDGNMTTDYEKYADYPHIGIDSIEKGTGELKGYRTVREDGIISGKYLFTPQHIIYSKIRPNLNKVALPSFNGLCSADAYPILPNSQNCNRVFLATAMRSEYFLEYILQFSSRTNLPKVNRKEISGFHMPLPPLELQNQFAAFVEQVNKSKAAIQKSLNEAQLLFDSLMQQYFG